jgi:predicted ATPase
MARGRSHLTAGRVAYLELQREKITTFDEYPFSIPAVRHLNRLALHPKVTFFVGENGSGKSTMVEALAVALGINPEGGTRNFSFNTRSSHSSLHQYLRVARTGAIRDAFFLRAESIFNVATEIERRDAEPAMGPPIIDSYGGISLHERSHGESFLAIAENRLGRGGFYLMDEPESALSASRQLTLLALLHEWVSRGNCQLVIATHSPLLLAYPDSLIYELDDRGIRAVSYEETATVRVYREFLATPGAFIASLTKTRDNDSDDGA